MGNGQGVAGVYEDVAMPDKAATLLGGGDDWHPRPAMSRHVRNEVLTALCSRHKRSGAEVFTVGDVFAEMTLIGTKYAGANA